MKKLYEQPKESLYNDMVTKPVQEPLSDNNELSPEDQEHINRMYAEIAKTSNQPLPGTKSLVFSVSKGKRIFNITGTPLEPLKFTMVGKGKFAERYKQQLENYLFTDGDINPDNLIPFIMLMEAGDSGDKVIRVVSKMNKRLLTDVVVALNAFFKEHQNIIKGMYSMFKGSMSIKEQEQKDV